METENVLPEGIPSTIGKYTVLREIGRGGFATVVCAIDPKTEEKVAIKIFNREHIEKGGYLKYLENELRLCARISHPNIVHIHDVVYTPENIMLIMEYLQSGNLQTLISRGVHFSINEQLKIAVEILSAIQYLHKRGICHRDIKPENILFDRQFHVKLIDFGLSKENSAILHTYCGTPFYMAPDLVKSDEYDGTKCDIWAFGVTLHVLATRLFPFQYSNEHQFLRAIQNENLEVSIVPKGIIGKLCIKSLEMNPTKRSGADELLQMIEGYLNGSEIYNRSGVAQIKQNTTLPKLRIRAHSPPSDIRIRKIEDKSLKARFNVRMRSLNYSKNKF